MPKEGDAGARLTVGGLEVTFVWRGDRFEHLVIDADGVLRATGRPTVESPVYQEVHQQGDLVFASGMSGDRHWSASIEAADGGGLLFDVACRAKTRSEGLGVAYEGDAKLALEPADEASAVSAISGAFVVVPQTPAGDPPCTVRVRYRITPSD